MRSVISLNGQTTWDIALRHMGSTDSVFKILELNPSLRLDETIETGTTVYLPDTPDKPRVVEYYSLNNLDPSTGIV